MASGPVRQHYSLATGGGLQTAENATRTRPKFARGGKVDCDGPDKYARGGKVGRYNSSDPSGGGTGHKTSNSAYFVGTNASGKQVTTKDVMGMPGHKVKGGNFSAKYAGVRVRNMDRAGMPAGGNFKGKNTGLSAKAAGSEASFKRGVNESGLPGDDKFTSVTQPRKQLAKGFKVHRP